MTAKTKTVPEFQVGRGYEQADWDAVSDSPELTDAELASLRPARKILPPVFFEGLEAARAAEVGRRRRGRPKGEGAKVAVTLRVEPAVVERFKAGGKDWRRRMQEALTKAAGTGVPG